MIKIINRKKYDTDTAKTVGYYDNGCNTNDFYYFMEELYKKKTGEFFLYGEGNAMSKYSRECGNNNWSGSCNIAPLTEDEAKEWAETHLSGEKYIEIFGDVEE